MIRVFLDSSVIPRKKAWPPLFETFCERCAPEEDGDTVDVNPSKFVGRRNLDEKKNPN